MNVVALFFFSLLLAVHTRLSLGEAYYPNSKDPLERLVYFVDPSEEDEQGLKLWLTALGAIPDVNERLLKLIDRDYVELRNDQLLGRSMHALARRGSLTTDQLRRISDRLAILNEPGPLRSRLDRQFITGGLRIAASHPCSECEEVALKFLNDEDGIVVLASVEALSRIGSTASFAKVQRTIEQRERESQGMTDPILQLMEPHFADYRVRLAELSQNARKEKSPTSALSRHNTEVLASSRTVSKYPAMGLLLMLIIFGIAATWFYRNLRRRGAV